MEDPKSMRTLISAFLAIACVASISATAIASPWNASLSGRVVDVKTLAGVGGATVELYSVRGTHLLGKAKTDATGEFTITGLKGGEYRVEFARSGYQRTVIAGLFVNPGERMIEAGPMAMYPLGMAVPRPVG